MQLQQWHGNGQHEWQAGDLQALQYPWLVGWCSIYGSSGMLHGRGAWIEQSNGITQPSLLMMNITTRRLATTMMGARNIKTNLPCPPILQWLLQLLTGANQLPHIIKCFGKSFNSEIQCCHYPKRLCQWQPTCLSAQVQTGSIAHAAEDGTFAAIETLV